MKKTTLLVIVALLGLLTGCKTMFTKGGGDYRDGERDYKAGKYADAATKALSALAQNPEFPEAKDLLSRTTVEGPKAILDKIEQLKGSGDKFAYDKIFPLYDSLEQLHKVVSASPYASFYPTTSYKEKIAEAKEMATEAHYSEGLALVNKGDFRSARKAVPELQRAMNLTDSYKDVEDLIKKATELSQVDVVVVGAPGAKDAVSATVKAFEAKKMAQTTVNDESAIGGFTSLDAAKSAAKAGGFELLVVVETGSPSGARKTNTEKDVDLSTKYATLKGIRVSVGYEKTMPAKATVYDVSGAVVAEKDLSIQDAKSYTYAVIDGKASGGKVMKLDMGTMGSGNFNVMAVTDLIGYLAFNPHKKTKELAGDFISQAQFLDDFSDYLSLFDGETLYANVDLICADYWNDFHLPYEGVVGTIAEGRTLTTKMLKAANDGVAAATKESKNLSSLYTMVGSAAAALIQGSILK